MNAYIEDAGKRAAQAAKALAKATSGTKTKALFAAADALVASSGEIIEANAADMQNAKGVVPDAMLDRLRLDEKRIEGMAQAMRDVAMLDDPVGKTLSGTTRPNGLVITKVTVPLGVIAVIYESRPNVTSDAASLCLKAGSACILRGGKEAMNSNKAIAKAIRGAVESAGLPADCVILIEDPSHETAEELMRANEYVDVLIPRGGKRLIDSVVKNASVPTIKTGDGNCHIYVDASADPEKAANIVFNAKTSRVSVCNACESLVIHKDALEKILPLIKSRLDEKNVTYAADERAIKYLPGADAATEEAYAAEYLDYRLSVKTVDSIDEAIEHIEKYSTKHSEAIITEDYEAAQKFTSEISSAAVYVNASTRFTDGGEFGFGAEIGISTQKLHARGPVGLAELTSTKYVVRGNGQIR